MRDSIRFRAHEFYLDELVADCTHAARSLASAKQISLTCEVPEELPIRADEGLLRRMILNLCDNAIKYTPAGGRVTVSAGVSGAEYALSVTDSGEGIPGDYATRVRAFFRWIRPGHAPNMTAAARAGTVHSALDCGGASRALDPGAF